MKPPLHLQPIGERRKSPGDLRARNLKSVQLPFHAHQKQSGLRIDMIIRVNDVAVILKEEFRNPRHQTFLVRATNQQYGCRWRWHRDLSETTLSRFARLRSTSLAP